ncbi:MAG: DUF4026 domain-containing protein [Oscillospiraceae bacterium]|nr:DUF4026 domain-containing protein [Oscillospiraceae bacterium]
MFGKKKSYTEQPLGYWEQASYFMAIPEEGDNKWTPDKIVEAIKEIEGVEIKNTSIDGDTQVFYVLMNYDGEEYQAGFCPGGFSLPESFAYGMRNFAPEEAEKMKSAKEAMTISMAFKSEPKKSFHLQLKLAVAVVPNLIGLVDESAERVFHPKWAKLAAQSKVSPAAGDLFGVQAVSAESGAVWLHTHGLCRCGLTELEILNSDVKNYNNHYNLLFSFASYLLDNTNKDFDPAKDIAYIGLLTGNIPVVATCRSWTAALNEYGKLELGGEKDRQEAHNSRTSPVFIYKSPEDMKKGKLTKVNEYDKLWGENPIFFFSDAETARMKALAEERFDYVKRAFENKENHILIKIGLETDHEDNNLEHIWFELTELAGDKFRARLTQEPYDVSGIHQGDEREFTVKDITDWIIYTPKLGISPSDVYLLDV